MYNHFQLAKKYLQYFATASNGKGHGTHSPFVFDFIIKVLNDNKKYDCYQQIEQQRAALIKNENSIEVEDFGAGSTVLKSNIRVIKNIAKSSLKPKKYAQLLFRMVQYYQPKTILELGTSLGITSSYLAMGNPNAQIYTCEGSKNIAGIAQQNFEKLHLKNIQIIQGDFKNTLPTLLSQLNNLDFVFVDGNHQKEPTLEYFLQILEYSNTNTLMVFDDIHWSKPMEEAWAIIKLNPQVTITIDLFFIGIVCINPAVKEKQDFVIRF